MPEMPPPDWLQQFLGVKAMHVAAGIAGGLVRGMVRPEVSWTRRLTVAAIGGLTAGYGTPAVAPAVAHWAGLWGYPAVEIAGAVGFLLGLCGMTLCDAAINWARRFRDWPPPRPPAPG